VSALAFGRPHRRRDAVLNVTPLIDVLFLLIIFFTMTSTFKRAGELELELPGSTSSGPATEHDAVTDVEVVLMNDGQLLLDGNVTDLERLAGELPAPRGQGDRRDVGGRAAGAALSRRTPVDAPPEPGSAPRAFR